MSKETIVTRELLQVLNGRLQDADAKLRDDQIEIKSLASIDGTVNGAKQLGATDQEVAGLLRFKEKLAKKLIKKHKIKPEEIEPPKKEIPEPERGV